MAVKGTVFLSRGGLHRSAGWSLPVNDTGGPRGCQFSSLKPIRGASARHPTPARSAALVVPPDLSRLSPLTTAPMAGVGSPGRVNRAVAPLLPARADSEPRSNCADQNVIFTSRQRSACFTDPTPPRMLRLPPLAIDVIAERQRSLKCYVI
ncbi:MAG: hypothetical protein M3354_06445 [Chloroflexota bacterium]|nr:hypothetical protein [Chloroflexota bacterium]